VQLETLIRSAGGEFHVSGKFEVEEACFCNENHACPKGRALRRLWRGLCSAVYTDIVRGLRAAFGARLGLPGRPWLRAGRAAPSCVKTYCMAMRAGARLLQ